MRSNRVPGAVGLSASERRLLAGMASLETVRTARGRLAFAHTTNGQTVRVRPAVVEDLVQLGCVSLVEYSAWRATYRPADESRTRGRQDRWPALYERG